MTGIFVLCTTKDKTGMKTRQCVRAVETVFSTNRELVDEFLTGNINAARVFHARYSKRISRLVWRLLGSDTEHEDVVQQVFMNIFKDIRKLKKAESLDSWVDSVAVRTVRTVIRKRTLRRAIFFSSDSKDGFESRDTKSPFKERYIKTFYEILDSMNIDDRIIFYLKHVEKCSINYIASVGNYSPSTAKRRLNRARQIFAKKAHEDFSLLSLLEESHAV